MNLYKNIFLVLFLSFSFSERGANDAIHIPADEIKVWDAQIKETKNPELRAALEKLREEYISNKNNIRKDFKLKIEPYKKQKDIDIESLKKEFQLRKESLMKKYGTKPKKIRKNKKTKAQNIIPKAKKPGVIKPSKKKPSKVVSSEIVKQNSSFKKPILKKDENEESSDKK